jgi:hypothetical protein
LEDLNNLLTLKHYILDNKNNSANTNTALDILNKSLESRTKGPGAVNPPKGVYEPDNNLFKWTLNARGIREKYFSLNFEILREIAQKVGPVVSIQNLRAMQVRAASNISYNDDDIGFRVKIKDKKRNPDRKEKKTIEEIEEFLLNCGYTDFPEADEREEKLVEMNEQIGRELLTIDQVAVTPRRNRRGKIIDYFILDGATIKRTVKDTGYLGDKRIRFVQEIDSKIVETFTNDDMVFFYSNRRTNIRQRGYGYSFLEMCIDIITSWLFGMAYNKEFFNTSSQPKGFLSFDGENIEQTQLEELQRQWGAMFRGIKGMWKTPFLQYNAKWNNMAPSNRDMEYNQYIQMLASWIFAIHGTDSQEVGIRLNQAQNVLSENVESKIAFSHDRGLKFQLTNIAQVHNLVIWKQEEWKDFIIVPTGLEARNQKAEVEVDNQQVKTYMTLNDKRKEKDLPPDPYGDIILDPQYIQYRTQKEQMEMQKQQQEQYGDEDGQGFDNGSEEDQDQNQNGKEPSFEISESDLQKSKNEYVEIIF